MIPKDFLLYKPNERNRHVLPIFGALLYVFFLVCVFPGWSWNLSDELSRISQYANRSLLDSIRHDFALTGRFHPLYYVYVYTKLFLFGYSAQILRVVRVFEFLLLTGGGLALLTSKEGGLRWNFAALALATWCASPAGLEQLTSGFYSETPAMLCLIVALLFWGRHRAYSYLALGTMALLNESFLVFVPLPYFLLGARPRPKVLVLPALGLIYFIFSHRLAPAVLMFAIAITYFLQSLEAQHKLARWVLPTCSFLVVLLSIRVCWSVSQNYLTSVQRGQLYQALATQSGHGRVATNCPVDGRGIGFAADLMVTHPLNTRADGPSCINLNPALTDCCNGAEFLALTPDCAAFNTWVERSEKNGLKALYSNSNWKLFQCP